MSARPYTFCLLNDPCNASSRRGHWRQHRPFRSMKPPTSTSSHMQALTDGFSATFLDAAG